MRSLPFFNVSCFFFQIIYTFPWILFYHCVDSSNLFFYSGVFIRFVLKAKAVIKKIMWFWYIFLGTIEESANSNMQRIIRWISIDDIGWSAWDKTHNGVSLVSQAFWSNVDKKLYIISSEEWLGIDQQTLQLTQMFQGGKKLKQNLK